MPKNQIIDNQCDTCRRENKGSYYVPVACSNCEWSGWLRSSKGHEVSYSIWLSCPNCACSTTLKRDYSRKVSMGHPTKIKENRNDKKKKECE